LPFGKRDDCGLREVFPVARQRAPPRLRQSPSDRRRRVDVDDEQRLLEARRSGQHLALVVEHARVAVEDELVLAADCVHECDEGGSVARPLLEHLLSLAVLADVERRGGDVHEQLCSGEREVDRGRPRLPHVLADGDPDQRLAEPEHDEVAPRREVPLLVEDAVVREEALPVDRLHLAACADGARVVEVAVEVGGADERRDLLGRGGDLLERPARGAHEPRPQEQILRRVAGDGELREQREIRAGRPRLLQPGQDQRPVTVQVADSRVDLREREPHLVFASKSKTYRTAAAISRSASGFSTDDMSPGSSPSAVARTARRTILAERVFGNAGTNSTRSGANALPSAPATRSRTSFSAADAPGASTQKSHATS